MKIDSNIENNDQFRQHSAAEVNEQVQILMRKQDWLSAIALVKKFPELSQSSMELSWSLGWSYFKLDRFKEARKYMRRALEIVPEHSKEKAVCYGSLGTIYLRLENYKKAEANLKKALSLGDSSMARMSLALTLLTQGKIEESEQVHLEGIKLRPDRGERYKSYGCFLSDVGRREEALLMYKKARAIRAKKGGNNTPKNNE